MVAQSATIIPPVFYAAPNGDTCRWLDKRAVRHPLW